MGGYASVTFESDGLRLVGDCWEVPNGCTSRGSVVLLHGGGQTRHSWRTSGPDLAALGWTCVAPDARGHGESGWARDGDYSIDALLRDLRVIVGCFDEPPVLVGASMGGNTALVAQGEDSQLGSALVLVDIAPRIEPVGVRQITEFMSAHPEGFATLEEVSEAVQAYNPHRRRPSSLEGLKKNVRLGSDRRWHWHWDPAFLRRGDEPTRVARYERLAGAARGVDVPTLVVRGKNSAVLSEDGVAELLGLIPHAIATEAAAGHMVAGDDNAIFIRQVTSFLDALPGR